nr:MAG TPA: Major tail protein [Caudoviricetes sp.]
MAEATETLKALNEIKSRVGTSIGNGQCYGLVALYSQLLGGCNIGGGINNPNPDGNGRQADGSDTQRGMSASNIGGDYNWEALGWKVRFDPSFSDLRVGCIVNYKPSGSNIWGHTSVISAVNGSSYDVIEQNYAWSGYTTERTGIDTVDNIESIIYPPEVVAGGDIGEITGNTGDRPLGNGDYSKTAFDVEALLIEVDGFFDYKPNIYEIPNLLEIAYNQIQEGLRSYMGKDDLEIEVQLLNSEFTEIELYDIYGNSYVYQPQYLPRTIDPEHKYKVIVNGSLGDSNQVHINFLEYNNANNVSYADQNILDTLDSAYWAQHNPEHFKYGLNDITGKSVAILNDQEASYIQTHKNQMEHTQLTFKENRETLKQSVDLSNKQVANANSQASYNAQYAVDSANIKQWTDGIGGLLGAGGKLFSGDIGGALGGLASTGMGVFTNNRDYNNKIVQQGFTDTNNALNSQSNALNNMKSKIALDQSIRAYNASMADLQNQPISVQQIGNDLAFQAGNRLTDVYWKVSLAQKEIMGRANEYIKCYGVLVNWFSNNALSVMKSRKRFNYIKMINVNLGTLRANQSHMNALMAIFQSGVRIWNYSANKDDKILFDIKKNNPNF